MDYNVVDIHYTNVNQPYAIVAQMPAASSQHIIYRSDNKAFSVDMIERDGMKQITLQDARELSKDNPVYDRADMERFLGVLGAATEKASIHSVDTMLQHITERQGSEDTLRPEERTYVPHPFMPPQYNKDNAVRFMRFYGEKLMDHAQLISDDQKQFDLGNILVSYSTRLEDDKYSVRDVQSIFNAIGQREPLLMNGTDFTLKTMAEFDTKLYEMSPYKKMFKDYASHRSHDNPALSVQVNQDSVELVLDTFHKDSSKSHGRV